MIARRAAAPGPGTAAHQEAAHSSRAAHLRASLVTIAACVALTAITAACGATQAPSSSATPSGSSAPATAVGSGAPDPSADPSPRRWPADTITATIALGAADAEIGKAGADLQAAVDNEDLRAMWGAADGLAKLIDANTANVAALDLDPATSPAAALYRQAFPELGDGAKQLRDAITAGDSAGILAASRRISQGLADYAAIRKDLGDLVEQAVVQKRLYLR
ncbi:MAG: hypothetical protein ACJ761_10605 [Chloroflexota bacterium]